MAIKIQKETENHKEIIKELNENNDAKITELQQELAQLQNQLEETQVCHI